jgi:hypothetical protein
VPDLGFLLRPEPKFECHSNFLPVFVTETQCYKRDDIFP